tara:strand:+ start:22 stop:261 length:240 start_codon:yes stop_codon:yes gene_type:complete
MGFWWYKLGEKNMTTYEIKLNNEFDVSNLLQALGTTDIDAVSMLIDAETLDQAKVLYKQELFIHLGLEVLNCEIKGKEV